jgi:hypothetical protein
MLFRRALKLITSASLVAALVVAPAATASAAKKASKPVRPALTKLVFNLDDSEVNDGDSVTGTVSAYYRSGTTWVALSGATLSVTLDKVAVDPVVTGVDGSAPIEATAAVGSHVIKVSMAKSSSYTAAKRAQGFDVLGTWYTDLDADGYGDAASPVQATSQPSGSTADDTDCDDADATVNPGATEVADNGIDEDCDGVAS